MPEAPVEPDVPPESPQEPADVSSRKVASGTKRNEYEFIVRPSPVTACVSRTHTTAFVTVVPDEPSFLVVEKVATRVTQFAQRHVVA
jgi:hypothetical protein